MHELGIITSVMEAVGQSAHEAGANKVIKVSLSVGEMTEAIEESLQFSYEILSETDPLFQGSELVISMVPPKSHCNDCGAEFVHDRFHVTCPECDSIATTLIAGRDLTIDSIEVDIPDEDDAGAETQVADTEVLADAEAVPADEIDKPEEDA